MSATQVRNQLKQAIAAAFTGRLPSNLPESVRDQIISDNQKIGRDLANAIFATLDQVEIRKETIQQLISNPNVMMIKLTDLM